ncbi:DUF6602 domain-containing protein [uncultured Draconibacterium sp.]|uniref:DUF6602 domain-containing protein n=1 Tax=uncultured Draconibacterium sp. TaxID=1573823 RepID=UPI002AA92207|nr:DUF6602 domain-containing protein [uncultured Draconibacterium sp.]
MAKAYYKARPAKANPKFKSKFEEAIHNFSGAFIGSSEFKHSLTKGEQRELPLKLFLEKALPSNFGIKPGEVVDCFNSSSPQIDLMIYDKTKTIEFFNSEAAIIPAESLLVSIEVKSKLTKEEIKKILKNSTALKELKPFKKKPQLKQRGDESTAPHCRYFHCIFAYETDFKTDDWAKSEYQRLKEVAVETNTDIKTIDRIYVAQKGIINPVVGQGANEEKDDVRTLMYYFSHILNFAIRENNRRKPVPYELYAGRQSKGWKNLE